MPFCQFYQIFAAKLVSYIFYTLNFQHKKTKIEEVASQVKDGEIIAGGGRGYPPEAKIPTPNGRKTYRRPDILVKRPDGSLYGINVGKTTAKGAPIKREVEALYDLEDAGIPMWFISYDK